MNFRVISLSLIRALPVLFLEWSVDEVKSWVLDVFRRSELAKNFEDEEIDGRILLSSMVRTDEAMEKLGLNTLGKKGKLRNLQVWQFPAIFLGMFQSHDQSLL